LGITRFVRLEIIEGALNKSGLSRALTLLNDFEHVEVIDKDLAWASIELSKYRLSHNVGAMDCLIAASSYRLQVPLYTMNLKHFTPLIGSLAQKPY
jgi:predicted nucleic acid-binding protein